MTESVGFSVEFLIVIKGGNPAQIQPRVCALVRDLTALGCKAAAFRVEDGIYFGLSDDCSPPAAADSGESS